MNEIKPIKWKNQVVITTALLAKVYGTSEQQIQQNFNNHKDNFIEGKHYYYLQGEELKEFKRYFDNIEEALGISKFTPQLYLWTERGANRHCKILDTDKAWEQFDNLEENYFTGQQKTVDLLQLSPELQMFKTLLDVQVKNELEQKRLAKEIEEVKQAQVAIEQNQKVITDTFKKTDDSENFQKWANSCISKIAESPNFNKGKDRSENYKFARKESYTKLSDRRSCKLDDRVQNAMVRALKNNPDMKKTELQKINKIYIIANDKDLRTAYESVIREMMMCYCTN